MSGDSPKPTIATPHSAAEIAMARPCRRTWFIHPLVADTAKAPTDGTANISPVAHGACSSTAMNGNSAVG